ncbi:asparaginase [Microbacterium sp. ISL-103]|nr:asparaginase [Microbacterium sp. ISL-103]
MKRSTALTATLAAVTLGGIILSGCTATSDPGAESLPPIDATPTPVAPASEDLPNVVVIDAGGTLSSTAEDRISYQHYAEDVDGGLTTIVGDLYPELESVANVSVVETASLGSSSAVTDEILYTVSRAIDTQLANDDVDAVVVTGGTNVLEEDAYFFDLTVQSPKPVIVTGAMHQYGTFTYDGYTNVFSSIRLAASGKTTCYGTVVLMNDQFFSARDVTKTDGYRMDTFEGGPYGALGVVNEDVIRTMRAPARVTDCGTPEWATPFDLSTISAADLARVEIISGYVDASPDTVTGAASNAEGIITAGHGPGNMSAAQNAALEGLTDVTVVAATRTTGEGTYSDPESGAIGAGDLLPQKARLLLQLSLTFTDDRNQVSDWFRSIGDREFDYSAALDCSRRGPAGHSHGASVRLVAYPECRDEPLDALRAMDPGKLTAIPNSPTSTLELLQERSRPHIIAGAGAGQIIESRGLVHRQTQPSRHSQIQRRTGLREHDLSVTPDGGAINRPGELRCSTCDHEATAGKRHGKFRVTRTGIAAIVSAAERQTHHAVRCRDLQCTCDTKRRFDQRDDGEFGGRDNSVNIPRRLGLRHHQSTHPWRATEGIEIFPPLIGLDAVDAHPRLRTCSQDTARMVPGVRLQRLRHTVLQVDYDLVGVGGHACAQILLRVRGD